MRRAFTLVEVIVAITIAGIIALAARAALVAGMDTEERLQLHTTTSEGDARFRSLLTDALRHMTDSPVPGLAPFAVRDTVVDGRPGQTAEFYSRGLGFPAGTGAILRIIVAASSGGLTITALHTDGGVVLRGVAPSLAAMNVRAKTPAGLWLEVWPQTLQVPVAVTLAFATQSTDASSGAIPPLVVSTRLEDPQ
jgi:prepilin-type N-terminal cleavage/methylation domain-containing protein